MNFILCIGITIYRTSQSHHPPAIVEDAPALAAVPPALAAVPPALAAVPPALAAVPQALAAAPLAPEIIALPPRERIVRRRNGEVVGRFVGNRLIRERNAPALRQERRIIVPQPALAEPLLWENLPHQQVPNELVRLLFRPPAAQIQQPRLGPFDICNICLDRPADWGIDSCEHHFCRDCVLQLLQEREALGFRLRASVCHYCRKEILIAYPLINPEQMEIQN